MTCTGGGILQRLSRAMARHRTDYIRQIRRMRNMAWRISAIQGFLSILPINLDPRADLDCQITTGLGRGARDQAAPTVPTRHAGSSRSRFGHQQDKHADHRPSRQRTRAALRTNKIRTVLSTLNKCVLHQITSTDDESIAIWLVEAPGFGFETHMIVTLTPVGLVCGGLDCFVVQNHEMIGNSSVSQIAKGLGGDDPCTGPGPTTPLLCRHRCDRDNRGSLLALLSGVLLLVMIERALSIQAIFGN
ncbi:hypothetical protein N658DRAFT_357490 [Parathielavia hyrcaniae]|uniref:Uncharacterized protein n=1 Tax=Parathielavia hyrcaniae TaxID=113614 RepID=A0AAN6Q2C5_9PEZI|nr:hypothetical protein N658DRAFT_357490 [Parathielavia hyrcaniae]